MNETIFLGGVVAAGPKQTPQRDLAIVVREGRIVEVGPAGLIRSAHPRARVIDATGGTILPGLTDAHGHLYGLGLSLDTVDLVDTRSFDEVLARVRQRAATTPAGDWVIGRGWDQNDWPTTEFPSAGQLDAAVADHPVWLKRIDGHAGLANSAAMKAAGVNAATKDPEGGRIVRDANGNPTGVFIDNAQGLIERVTKAPSYELRKQRILKAAQAIAANGLTEMHDAGADEATIRAVRELVDEGKFPIRVYLMLSDNEALFKEWFGKTPLIDYGGRMTVRAVKLYADGALGSRGAALLAPYSDDPGNRGLLVTSKEHIEDVARRARIAGFQVNTHAIGDRAVRDVIDAYEHAEVQPDLRWRIEHLQVVAPSDFARLAKDGIIASVQPTHATSDMPWAERRLGAARLEGAYAWQTVLHAGARLALGSDFPVERVNPFHGIYAAVTRQDQQGNPPGGWFPQQRLTLAEAIRGFTSDAAYAAFEEISRGTIEPGKLADFTIVAGDFYAMPQRELFKATVLYTVVGGEIVHSSR
jgi:predicted amidohydrolase YtcJ